MELVHKKYKQTKVGTIPEDWKVISIPEIISKRNGIKIGPFGSQLKKNLLTKSGYKVYGQENVYENNVNIGDRYIGKSHFEKLKSCELNSGDFLISMMGTIGKTMIVPMHLEPGIMDSHLLRLRLNENVIDPTLMHQHFSSKILLDQIMNLSVGGIMAGLSSKIIRQILLPIPPTLNEQTAIATALSDMDSLISNLEKLVEKKRMIKQGVMQELFRPKEGWELKPLGEIATITMGQSPLSEYYNYEGKGLPLVQGNADIKKRRTILRTFTSSITKRGKAGDIIMSVRAPVGEIARASFDCCLGRGVCSISYKNDYLYHYLVFIEDTWSQFSSGSTFDSINSVQLKSTKIGLPKELSEQIQIGDFLNTLDIEIQSLEELLTKQQQMKVGLMQSLLTGKIRLV